jgi:hypothetical protein
MNYTMLYCTHCLHKLTSNQEVTQKDGSLYFFLPVMDGLQRAFYVYVQMARQQFEALEIDRLPARSIDLHPLVEILHVEEGWWPNPERMGEIKAFYHAATHYQRHNIQVAA